MQPMAAGKARELHAGEVQGELSALINLRWATNSVSKDESFVISCIAERYSRDE